METHSLSATLEDYLEAIYQLVKTRKVARVGAIAEKVSVHKSTVTAALHSLAKQGYVNYTPYKPVTLTPAGKKLGAKVYKRHKSLHRFLRDVLDIDTEEAEETACKMEHVIPPHIIKRFSAFADFVETCPRADALFANRCETHGESDTSRRDCATCLRETLEYLEKKQQERL